LSATTSRRPSAAASRKLTFAPRSTRRRAAFHWPNATASSSGVPPGHRAGRVDVRSGVEQRVQHRDVVAARGPVQRGLGDPPAAARVDVAPGGDQRPHDGGAVGDVAGPVRRDVQQRPAVATARIGDERTRHFGLVVE
jgi:hypothetical protein